MTAAELSALRPRVPIIAATDREDVARRLALAWGVAPVVTELGTDMAVTAGRIGDELVRRGKVEAGAVLVLVGASATLAPGSSTFLKIQRV
jgi:pyruvate kinase